MIAIIKGGIGDDEIEKKQHIIISIYLEGKSQRAIARETGIDRKTIRKYVK